jgi:hypothetical protein
MPSSCLLLQLRLAFSEISVKLLISEEEKTIVVVVVEKQKIKK